MVSGEKSRPKSGRFKKGVRHPDQGKGPKKGAPNAGRPPDRFRKAMAAIANDPKALALLKAMARGESDLAMVKDAKTNLPIAIDGHLVLKAHDHAAKHGIGMPAQVVTVTDPDGNPVAAQMIVFGGVSVAF